MRSKLFTLPILVCALSTLIFTGDPPAPPCGLVQGELEILSITEDAISGTVSGDLEGTYDAVITEVTEHDTPIGIITSISADGTWDMEEASLGSSDHIKIIPSGMSETQVWLGLHFINSGGVGFVLSVGAFDAKSGVVASYFGFICTMP